MVLHSLSLLHIVELEMNLLVFVNDSPLLSVVVKFYHYPTALKCQWPSITFLWSNSYSSIYNSRKRMSK